MESPDLTPTRFLPTAMFGAIRLRFPPTIRQLLSAPHTSQGSVTEVCGWVKSVRRQKNVTFAVVSDGSSTRGLQAVFARDIAVPEKCVLCFRHSSRAHHTRSVD